MQRHLRNALCLVLLALATAALAACGGEDASSASVEDLLNETFSGEKDVKSGKLDVNVKLDVKGAGSELQGPVTVKLSGPFESTGEGKLPKFDLDLSFQGAGQSIKAGATSTGEKGFVNFNGQEYAVSQEIFQQFRTGFEQAAKESKGQDQSLQSLGLDPRAWLTNAKNAGEAKVGDADTIKITGGVDIPKLLDDVNKALSKAGQLGLQGQAPLPTELTAEQKEQVAKAIKDLSVEIHTGADDKILRRIRIVMSLADPTGESDGSADVDFDLSILDLNEGQDISEPENTKPFEELIGQLGGLGLGGLGAGGAAGGDSGGAGAGGAGSTENLEEYTKCIEEAGSDVQKAQACAELLTG